MAIEKTEEGLKRVIGVPGLALSIVNGVIGSGIFVLPAIVSTELSSFSVFGYIFCGIMLAAILFCCCLETSSTPISGQIISNKNKPNLDSQKNGNFKKFTYGFKTYG